MNLVRTALATTVIALTGCHAAQPRTTVPKLSNVPVTVVEAMCARLHSEGIAGASPLYIVKNAQPLITAASVTALGHAYSKSGDSAAAAQALNSVIQPVPVEFKNAHSCAWTGIDRLDPVAYAQLTVVEFSAPFPNPFTRGEGGVLVRMSIGGHDAQWYWVPLAERNGQLGIGLVMPLDMHDG